MKFGLNGLRSWDRSIWIIPKRESTRQKSSFSISCRPLMKRKNFPLRMYNRIVVVLEGEGEEKKRRVNWQMQFWRNSLGVNCSILHNSNNSRTSCIITWIWDSAGLYIIGRGGGEEWVSAIFTIPWREIRDYQLSRTWINRSIEGDMRSRNCSRVLYEFVSNLFVKRRKQRSL